MLKIINGEVYQLSEIEGTIPTVEPQELATSPSEQ